MQELVQQNIPIRAKFFCLAIRVWPSSEKTAIS